MGSGSQAAEQQSESKRVVVRSGPEGLGVAADLFRGLKASVPSGARRSVVLAHLFA